MSLAEDVSYPRSRSRQTRRTLRPEEGDRHRPDQRHLGYSSPDYAASNPWYNQPRSQPIYGLAESLPHTVRHGQGARHRDREDKAQRRHEPPPDVEKGEGREEEWREGRGRSPPRSPGMYKENAEAGERKDRERRDGEEGKGKAMRREREEESEEAAEEAGDREEAEIQAWYNRHRNLLARLRARHPEAFAEYLCTTITVFLALCGNLSYRLNPNYGTYESLCWTNGLATMAGIYLAGGVSGAHINPVISIVLAVYRGFPWHKVWVYAIAQFFGSITAGGLAYSIYHDAIHAIDPALTANTGKSFYTIPQRQISTATAFWSEFMSIATLTCIIFALGDDQNSPPGAGMNAFIIGLVTTLNGLALGYNTGPCLNPMRDMTVRLVALMVGYGSQTFTTWWWIGGCWGADLAGGMIGGAAYDIFVFTGNESPINYLWPTTQDMMEKLGRIFNMRQKE